MLGMVGAFAELARRLAPALLVLEDVDLVAQERMYGPFGSSPILFELMNQMDGLGDDADIAFVLTTNRPDALEPAPRRAAPPRRPRRRDSASGRYGPAAAARGYARGPTLDGVDVDGVVGRTRA